MIDCLGMIGDRIDHRRLYPFYTMLTREKRRWNIMTCVFLFIMDKRYNNNEQNQYLILENICESLRHQPS